MKYRKKPIIIEAYQIDVELDIETLEGVMHASIGDYIITGVNGEKYPCKPDIFEKTYELVEENNYKNKMSKALEALEELTVVLETNSGTRQYNDIFEIHLVKPIEIVLKSLKIFEEELGIDLISLLTALTKGYAFWKYDNFIYKIEIEGITNCCLKVNTWYYANTNKNGKRYGDDFTISFKDYGKTWALTKEKLENDK